MEIIQILSFVTFSIGLTIDLLIIKEVSLFPKLSSGTAYTIALILLAFSNLPLSNKAIELYVLIIAYMFSKIYKLNIQIKEQKAKKIEIKKEGEK